MKTRQFVDCVTVHVQAGNGGNGSASFRREAHVERGGPDGGDGGRGGHVIFRGDRNEDSLIRLYYSPRVTAEDGGAGRGQQMHGRNGADQIVHVPRGTSIHDATTGDLLFDITDDGQEFVAARGGKGGLGNVHWKTATHQAPTECTPGDSGVECRLRLELKVIAELGLIGFPNAGKSSLLAALSSAHPKIASYPFTTLNPIIGAVCFSNFSQVTIADIPGILPGAHAGVGLGLEFLRHLARSKALIFVVDAAGTEGRTPWSDYHALRREIRLHDPALLKRPILLVANKMDLPAAAANIERLRRSARREAIPVSTVSGEGLPGLRDRIQALIKPVPPGAGAPSPAPGTHPQGEDGPAIISAEAFARATFLDVTPPAAKKRMRRL